MKHRFVGKSWTHFYRLRKYSETEGNVSLPWGVDASGCDSRFSQYAHTSMLLKLRWANLISRLTGQQQTYSWN